MSINMTLFQKREIKSEVLTMRLTPREKAYLCVLSNHKKMPISRYLLNLVAADFASQIKESDAVREFVYEE